MKKINLNIFRTPPAIFVLYIFASCLLIMAARFIFPGEIAPLPSFARNWRLLRGLLEVLTVFPALALSAMVVPFGMIPQSGEFFDSFSPKFFARLNGPVTIAICSSVIYALVFFLAVPLARDYEDNLRFRAEQYRLAKANAETHRQNGEWLETLQFIGIAESVWENSPELESLKTEASIYMEELQFEQAGEREAARERLDEDPREAILPGASGQRQPANAAGAIARGEAAFADERFYDAHWLATLGTRLAPPGSLEAAEARELAGRAWNKIESQEPTRREMDIYSLYRKKKAGYEAMNSGDYIRAFYIFQELVEQTPDDPDVHTFFAISENRTRETSFFFDDMDWSLGHSLTGVLFSLPVKTAAPGRAVLRFSSLSTEADYAYGMGFEYLRFDSQARPLIRLNSPYAKLLPFTLEGQPKVLVLMRVLDQRDEGRRWEAEWEFGREFAYQPGAAAQAGGAQILLDISYEDFLILSRVRRGLSNISMGELFSASKALAAAGYIPQAFEAEILNRLGSVLFFLPMAIAALIIGWRYRARNRPRYFFILLLPVLPFVFHSLIRLYESISGNVGVWLTLSVGFTWALAIFIAATVLLFVSLLIILAAQHGD